MNKRTVLYFACTLVLLMVGLIVSLHAAGVFSGSNTCPSSGAKRVASTNTRAIAVSFFAPAGNMGLIHYGDSTVSTSVGYSTAASATFSLYPAGNAAVYDLYNIWFACSNSADTIRFTYVQ